MTLSQIHRTRQSLWRHGNWIGRLGTSQKHPLWYFFIRWPQVFAPDAESCHVFLNSPVCFHFQGQLHHHNLRLRNFAGFVMATLCDAVSDLWVGFPTSASLGFCIWMQTVSTDFKMKLPPSMLWDQQSFHNSVQDFCLVLKRRTIFSSSTTGALVCHLGKESSQRKYSLFVLCFMV